LGPFVSLGLSDQFVLFGWHKPARCWARLGRQAGWALLGCRAGEACLSSRVDRARLGR